MTGVRDNKEIYVTVCADNVRTGDQFEFEVEFEASPKPDLVEWIMQDQVGRRETVEEDETRGNYEAFRIKEDVSHFIFEIYFCPWKFVPGASNFVNF